MSRPLRIEYRGAHYHVMNRGTARQKIFLNDHDRQGFLDLLGQTSQMWGLQVYAYGLMDNHVLCGAPHKKCYVKFRIM